MRKKATGFVLIAVCLALCLSGCGSSSTKVPVMSVSEILGIGPVGMTDRFSGVVEAGETISVCKENDMDVAEIAVKEGDAVTKGQVLFSYETASLAIEVERMQLEVEQLNNTINTKKNQISALEKEQKSADSADKLQYTLQIQQLQLDIKETEYSVTSKQKDIDRSKTKLADANVLSPADGHIKSVNSGMNAVDPNTGEALPLIVIAEEGEFRVKGTVNEQNSAIISEGAAVIIRSRVDDNTMWSGTIANVDWENPISGGNDFYYNPSNEMSSSSKYPFYVKLESDDGLMIGQHVYIEQDIGQNNGGDEESGFYLPSYYLSDLDSDPWVWAVNSKDKLEKRPLELGNYNIELDSYEVLSGLDLDDFIAYPNENCKVGAPVSYPGEELEGIDEDFSEDIESFEEEGIPEDMEGFPSEDDGNLEGTENFPEDENSFPESENDSLEREFDEDINPEGDLDDTKNSTKKGGLAGFFENLFGKKSEKASSDTQIEEPDDLETSDKESTNTLPGDASVEDPGIAVVPGTEGVG